MTTRLERLQQCAKEVLEDEKFLTGPFATDEAKQEYEMQKTILKLTALVEAMHTALVENVIYQQSSKSHDLGREALRLYKEFQNE